MKKTLVYGLVFVFGVILVIGIGTIYAQFICKDCKVKYEAKIKAERMAGFHCLSHIDGANADMNREIKSRLRDPKSFEHIQTKISPINNSGEHQLFVTYRAKNGFGGYTSGMFTAYVANSNCALSHITSIR